MMQTQGAWSTTLPTVEFTVEPLTPFGVVIRPTKPGIELNAVPSAYWASLARQHQFVVLRGVDQTRLTAETMLAYAQGFGPLLEWPFGYVLDVRVEPNAKNYLFTRHRVEFHCDGVFARAEPQFLFFHCVEAPTSGGESLLADTHRVWTNASPEQRSWLSTLRCRYRQDKTAHYGGDVVLDVVSTHPQTAVTVLRYAEPVAGPGGSAPQVLRPDGGADGDQTALLATYMAQALYQPEVCLTHPWQDGDLVLLDNHRLLHGRHAFGDSSGRHLRRIHVL